MIVEVIAPKNLLFEILFLEILTELWDSMLGIQAGYKSARDIIVEYS